MATQGEQLQGRDVDVNVRSLEAVGNTPGYMVPPKRARTPPAEGQHHPSLANCNPFPRPQYENCLAATEGALPAVSSSTQQVFASVGVEENPKAVESSNMGSVGTTHGDSSILTKLPGTATQDGDSAQSDRGKGGKFAATNAYVEDSAAEKVRENVALRGSDSANPTYISYDQELHPGQWSKHVKSPRVSRDVEIEASEYSFVDKLPPKPTTTHPRLVKKSSQSVLYEQAQVSVKKATSPSRKPPDESCDYLRLASIPCLLVVLLMLFLIATFSLSVSVYLFLRWPSDSAKSCGCLDSDSSLSEGTEQDRLLVIRRPNNQPVTTMDPSPSSDFVTTLHDKLERIASDNATASIHNQVNSINSQLVVLENNVTDLNAQIQPLLQQFLSLEREQLSQSTVIADLNKLFPQISLLKDQLKSHRSQLDHLISSDTKIDMDFGQLNQSTSILRPYVKHLKQFTDKNVLYSNCTVLITTCEAQSSGSCVTPNWAVVPHGWIESNVECYVGDIHGITGIIRKDDTELRAQYKCQCSYLPPSMPAFLLPTITNQSSPNYRPCSLHVRICKSLKTRT